MQVILDSFRLPGFSPYTGRKKGEFRYWTRFGRGLLNLVKGRVTLTIKTSNSSRHLNGDSMVPHKAVRKEIVDTDLSPPDNDFMTDVLSSTLFPEYSSLGPLWTFTCRGPERKRKIKILCHNVYEIP